MLNLPIRPKKKRLSGLTAVTDTGIPVLELEYILSSYAKFLDVAKFGIGTAYIEPDLQNKIDLYREYDVLVYFGGTLFEKFYLQGKVSEYFKFLERYSINTVEISSGVVDISIEDRCNLIEQAKNVGVEYVFSEVGSKDNDSIMAPFEWIQEMKLLLDAGCDMLITEGRGDASAGIYRSNGEMREGLVKEIVEHIPMEKLMFEAPTTESQSTLIEKLGPAVNLANINIRELLLVEAQRQALKYETFFIK